MSPTSRAVLEAVIATDHSLSTAGRGLFQRLIAGNADEESRSSAEDEHILRTHDVLLLLLDENRQLRIELETLRAHKHARRGRQIAAVSTGVRLVKESELPAFVPWSVKKIKAARRAGKLKAYPDPLNPKTYIYNLDEVLATVRTGRAVAPRTVLEIPPHLKIAI